MKSKKNWLRFGIVTLLLQFICSCTTVITTAPILYTNNPNTEFEILGTVSTRSGSRVGYIDLYNEAKKRYPATDYVIDIMIDQYITTTSYHWIAFAVKQIFGTNIKKENVNIEYIMRGTAIKYIVTQKDTETVTSDNSTPINQTSSFNYNDDSQNDITPANTSRRNNSPTQKGIRQ